MPIYKKADKIDCSNYQGISLLSMTYKIPSNIVLSWLTPYIKKLLRLISVDFDITGQLLIICSTFVKYFRKKVEIQ